MNSAGRVLLASTVVVAGWLVVTPILGSRAMASTITVFPAPHKPYDAKEIDFNIKFHEGRVKRDAQGAIGWSMLADAYLARSRESDSDDFAWKAEDAARTSLGLRTRGNVRGFHALSNSLLEQHRFQDALAYHRSRGVRDVSTADILIETGELDECAKILQDVKEKDNPNFISTSARLAAARGEHAKALDLFKSAYGMVKANAGYSDQAVSWFQIKAADQLVELKRYDEAKSLYLDALKLYPRSYKATLGLARVGAATSDWPSVETYAKQTLEVANSLDAKALLGDAAKVRGDEAETKRWYDECRAMFKAEVARFDGLGKGGPLHVKPIDRQFATFCATHGMWADEAVPAAKRDLANRPDTLAHTNLATLQAQRRK